MIQSENEYYEAMRTMIRKVQQGYEPPFTADAEELEILSDCIKAGYLIGKTTYIDMDGVERESRTLDGKIHPELTNHVVPPKGLAFLNSPIEDHSSDNNKEADGTVKKALDLLKRIFKRFWALFCGLGAIVTVFGWPLIRRFISFLLSLFD